MYMNKTAAILLFTVWRLSLPGNAIITQCLNLFLFARE